MTYTTNTLRKFQGYKVIRAERDISGSFAVEYKGKKSRNFSSSTWSYYKNKSNADFRTFCKALLKQ